jgi:trehalose 6-phosphate phosphatase
VTLPELLRPVAADPGQAALLADFDGTLSPVVPDPAAARPLPGAAEVLTRLAARYGRVALISGRPVQFLADVMLAGVMLDGSTCGLLLSGAYGLESLVDGAVVTRPEAEPWIPVVTQVADEADRDSQAAIVERKRLSLTLHYRTAPERGDAVVAWAAAAAERHGLEARSARQSVELHPPLHVDKGTVVGELAAGMASVVYFGDDMGDLAAFAALDRLAASGVHAVKVVAASAETAPEVRAAADVLVEGPAGVLALLDALAG